jgi:hypothetical protein
VATVWRFELETVHVDSGSRFLTTQMYQTDLAPIHTEPSAEQVLAQIEDHYSTGSDNWTKWLNVMQSQLRLVRAGVREQVAPNSGAIPQTFSKELNLDGLRGSVSGDQLPAAMCVWLHWRTGVSSRSSRGGTHLPPALHPANLTAAGTWDGAYVTEVQMNVLREATIDVLEDVFGDSDLRPVIYSRTRRARGQSPWTFNVTTAQYSRKPRWLRRRDN